MPANAATTVKVAVGSTAGGEGDKALEELGACRTREAFLPEGALSTIAGGGPVKTGLMSSPGSESFSGAHFSTKVSGVETRSIVGWCGLRSTVGWCEPAGEPNAQLATEKVAFWRRI